MSFCCQNRNGSGPPRTSSLGPVSTKVGSQDGGSSLLQRTNVVRLKRGFGPRTLKGKRCHGNARVTALLLQF